MSYLSGGGGLLKILSGSAIPAVVQMVASSAEPAGIGAVVNNVNMRFPNPIGAGNCIAIALSYPNGATPTITDDNGNTWSSTPVKTADAGSGNYVSSWFVLPNANAGTTTFTAGFGTTVNPFAYRLYEITNIASTNPFNGGSSATSQAGATISSGSFTPTTNNDSNGGNLILSYFAPASIANQNPSSWTAGSGFTLGDADIAWNSNNGFPQATQYQVQANQAAINPSITATGDTNNFNCVSIALKAANHGTAKPAGIHIDRVLHFSTGVLPSSGTWKFQIPSTGNLGVLCNTNGLIITVTGVTDSDGNTWAKRQPAADESYFYDIANRTPNTNTLIASVAFSASSAVGQSWRYFDISGAATSPFDVVAGLPTTNFSGLTVINNGPSITPTNSNGVVIASLGLGDGPGLGFASGAPATAVFDLVTFSGETDVSLLDNADCVGHYYNNSTSTINWNWSITNRASNSGAGTAVAYKAA